jgi:RNA polymerase sigma-70 factor (ECF subfamily)
MVGGKSNGSAPAIAGNAEVHAGSPSQLPTFQELYRQNFEFVWSSVRHLGVGSDAVDDVVQDVFIVIHARLHTLERPEALRSWIYGIARRTVSHHHRSRRSRDAAGVRLGVEEKSIQPTPLDIAERKAEVELLQSILADLDEPKREIFMLVELMQMTVPEVAEALEIPLNTAYSRLRLARQSFEEALARREPREGRSRPC